MAAKKPAPKTDKPPVPPMAEGDMPKMPGMPKTPRGHNNMLDRIRQGKKK